MEKHAIDYNKLVKYVLLDKIIGISENHDIVAIEGLFNSEGDYNLITSLLAEKGYSGHAICNVDGVVGIVCSGFERDYDIPKHYKRPSNVSNSNKHKLEDVCSQNNQKIQHNNKNMLELTYNDRFIENTFQSNVSNEEKANLPNEEVNEANEINESNESKVIIEADYTSELNKLPIKYDQNMKESSRSSADEAKELTAYLMILKMKILCWFIKKHNFSARKLLELT